MDSSSIAAYVSLAVSLGAVVLGVINHKRIRSSCCGKEASVSLDIEATTPPIQKSEPLVYNGLRSSSATEEGSQSDCPRSSSPQKEDQCLG